MREYMDDKFIWYTVSVHYAGEEFPRVTFNHQDLGATCNIFDDMCERLLESQEPLMERQADISMYEQHSGIGSLLPMRKLEVQQDGKYRIGYLATPHDLRVPLYLQRKLTQVGVNDDYIPAKITT